MNWPRENARVMTKENTKTDRLYHAAELAQFYDLDNPWAADLEYCFHLAMERGVKSVLDLGCGTGRFGARLAEEGIEVVGADSAAAMLEIAKKRQGGDRVTWILGDARTLSLNRTFDLVLLTGHAFQVFLTGADQSAVLATVAAHLNKNGHFIFDTRNPEMEAWRDWTPDHRWTVDHPTLGDVEAWIDASNDPQTGVVAYETHYVVGESGAHYDAASKIRFTSQEQMAALIEGAGLCTEAWFGDWEGREFQKGSKEIIPIGSLCV